MCRDYNNYVEININLQRTLNQSSIPMRVLVVGLHGLDGVDFLKHVRLVGQFYLPAGCKADALEHAEIY